MERPVVTVILPAYNVEKYIEKAVDSICSQTLTDWEMYLIDDGSTDGTGDLCDNMAFSDSRIHVIHQENQGAAAARNLGIEKANGKYMYFMDGDDWASSDMLYDMVCLAEHYYLDAWAGVPVNNKGRELSSLGRVVQEPSSFIADEPEEKCAQMVITGFYIETHSSDSDYYIQKQSVKPRVFSDKSEFRDTAHTLFDRNLLYTPWNKLYLTSYIKENNILFPQRHWDDFPFNVDVIRNIERVTVSDNAYYHFIRQRQDSESEKYNLTLFDEREAENAMLIELYRGWRNDAVEKYMAQIRDSSENSNYLDEPDEPDLLTGTVGYISAMPTDEADHSEQPEQEKTEKTAADNIESEEDKLRTETGDEVSDAESDSEEDKVSDIEENVAAEENPESVEDNQNPDEENQEPVEDNQNPDEEKQLPSVKEQLPQVNMPSPEAKEFIARRYVERIVGCVENIVNPQSSLSVKEQREQIKNIIGKESVREALKAAKPRSLYMKAMLLPIRMKSASLTRMEGKVISKVKNSNAKVFAKLKDNR